MRTGFSARLNSQYRHLNVRNKEKMAPNGIAIIIGAGNNTLAHSKVDMNADCISPVKVQQQVQASLGSWPILHMATLL